MHFIIETNWISKKMNKGINEHYQSVKQACETIYGAEFIGLYKPLNDAWNWTHFMKVDSLEKWREIDREIHRLYPDVDNNIFYSISRTYIWLEGGRQAPPITNIGSMKYLVVDFNTCKEFDLGIHEYYNQVCEQFENLKGAGLLGLYIPWTENWNWALIKLFDSLGRFLDCTTEFYRTYKRDPGITSSIERVYERHEPKYGRTARVHSPPK